MLILCLDNGKEYYIDDNGNVVKRGFDHGYYRVARDEDRIKKII